MKRKNIGLLMSVSILLFMALFSEKKILVTTGYAVSQNEIDTGREIYTDFCRRCHDRARSGAPHIGDTLAWKERIEQGVDILIAHALDGYRGPSGEMPARGGNSALAPDAVAAAVAYMVKESDEQD